jgi:hypothetical protein
MKFSIASIGILYSLTLIALTLIGMNTKKIIAAGVIKDVFVSANLEAVVMWSGWEISIGFLFFVGVMIGLFGIKEKELQIKVIFGATLFFTYTTMIWIVPKIEAYSQRAAIEFYETKAAEKAYITTYGFKSYAHLFYAKKPIPLNLNHSNVDWLLNENTEQNVYVVTKNFKAKEFENTYPNFKKLYKKNGFVFYEKEPLNKILIDFPR